MEAEPGMGGVEAIRKEVRALGPLGGYHDEQGQGQSGIWGKDADEMNRHLGSKWNTGERLL